MPSLQSRLVIFTIKNRHLMQFRLKPDRVDWDTDTNELRRQYAEGAKKYGSIPAGIEVVPANMDGLTAEWIRPKDGPTDCAIFYTHGGGYVTGSCEDHRMHVAKIVQATGVPALLYDYRLAPEHPFPAGMQDTLAAYRWLLGQGIDPGRIVIVGESAGGGLCLATLLAIKDEGLPLPAAGVALSPWTDLTLSGESYRTNARRDISTDNSWVVWSRYYYADNDPTHPWISPVFGDMRGLPPILIEVGTREILLDDSRRFAERARQAGVDVTLRVWEGMVHCFPLLTGMFPEATQAFDEVCAYIRKYAGVK